MASETLRLIKHIGLSDKAAKIYLAATELGESSVQDLSEKSGIKRTTIYYILDELLDTGVLFQARREKKIRYIAELPRNLIQQALERLSANDSDIEDIGTPKSGVFKKPRIYFLYGPQGFKKIWNMIFALPEKEFRIITNGKGFLDFVKEKYIIDHIIETKRNQGVKSKQIIVDSSYARTIVAKDRTENRISKFLPSSTTLPFTEVITEHFVAFISPRFDNILFVVEHKSFAETRIQIFEELWKGLPSPTAVRQIHS